MTEARWTDDGTAIVLEGTLRSTRRAPRAGTARLLAPSLFLDEPRAAAFAAAERETPVDLGLAGTRSLRLRAPPGARATCPPPVSVESPFGTYTLACSAEGSAAVLDRSLVVSQTWIELEEYPAARRFWQAVLAGDRNALAFQDAGPVAESGAPRSAR